MEEWKSIEGYEEYLISNLGRVKSLKNGKEHIKTLSIDTKGYLIVALYKNSKRKNFSIHRLIGLYFIPNPNNYSVIDHINRNPLDNRIDNLRWTTQSINMINRTNYINNDMTNIVKRNDNGNYRVNICRNNIKVFDKTYKRLEDAIKARDQFLRDNK
jgi:hypothetical protein